MQSTDAGRRRRAQRAAIALLALGVFTACAAGASATGQRAGATGLPYKVAGKIGKEGTANGQFSANAYGVSTDKAGNVYVADNNLKRIQAFSAAGTFKAKYVFDAGDFVYDVAVGPTGDVWGTTQVGGQARRFPKGGGAAENVATPKSAEGIGVDADGNVYVATNGDATHGVVQFAAGAEPAKMWVGGGLQEPGDVEVAPDGTVYVADRRGSPPSVKHYDAGGKLLGTIKMAMSATAGAGAQYGIGVDPDCNVWATNAAQRRVDKFSASGKLLGSVTSGDLLGTDVAVGPKGDLYVFDINTRSVVRFKPDSSKPATAAVGGSVTVASGKARVKFTLSGVACPAEVAGVASLSGSVTGKAAVKVAAGRSTVLSIPVKGASGKAQFKIVLKTNGRPTTQVASVTVVAR